MRVEIGAQGWIAYTGPGIPRLVADILVTMLGQPRFTWGRINLVDAGETRRAYVAALRAADAEDIEPLLAFARS